MQSFMFGSTPEMADNLLKLVLEGKKTATCHAAATPEPPVTLGMRSIVMDSRGRHRAIIETTELFNSKFNEIDATFARDEGEGDLTLEHWRTVHKDFFTQEGTFADDMELCCERFKVVEILPMQ